MSEAFEQKAMLKGYRVLLTEEGDMRWATLEDDKEVSFLVEPDTGFWKRFTTEFLSIFVPESQL